MNEEEKKKFLKMMGYSGGDIEKASGKSPEHRRQTISLASAKYNNRRKKVVDEKKAN